ncbi:MAG: F0F1 ATP synthase subunit B [Bacteroidales bacterium]
MELITPGIGLLFWMVLIFSLLLFILGKYAWKPVLKSLKNRENSIEEALRLADKTREQMAQLKSDNEKLMEEARKERDKMMAEARDMKDHILSEARQKSVEEGKKLIDQARSQITQEKAAAIDEIRNMVAGYSVEIAEKLLRKKLEKDQDQQALIEEHIKSIRLN